MPTVDYSHEFNYRPLAPNWTTETFPALEITFLPGSSEEFSTFALIDTGATYTLFSLEIGEILGLNVSDGKSTRLRSLGGSLQAFEHIVELQIAYAWNLGEIAVHFAAQNLPRNFLGRDFLQFAQIGLWEKAGKIYLGQSQ